KVSRQIITEASSPRKSINLSKTREKSGMACLAGAVVARPALCPMACGRAIMKPLPGEHPLELRDVLRALPGESRPIDVIGLLLELRAEIHGLDARLLLKLRFLGIARLRPCAEVGLEPGRGLRQHGALRVGQRLPLV